MRPAAVLVALAICGAAHAGKLLSMSTKQAFASPLALQSTIVAPPAKCAHRAALRVPGHSRLCIRMGKAADSESNSAREIKNFLTQTLIFILDTGRDEITADWLEDWRNHTGVKRYHGWGALQLDWDDYVAELLREPPATVVVEMKRRGNGVGGWSKNNPYLQDHVFEYEEEIDPRKLAQRVMSLREEIASEWLDDLALIEQENDEVWRAFFEKVRENGEDAAAHLQIPAFQHDVTDANCGTGYRGGSYDLLKRLSTLRASQALLRSFSSSSSKEGAVKADWLERMLTVYGAEFEGDAGYHVDKKFLESLLASSPKLVQREDSDSMVMLAPTSIVEDLLVERSRIAREWRSHIEDIAADHTELKRALLVDTANV